MKKSLLIPITTITLSLITFIFAGSVANAINDSEFDSALWWMHSNGLTKYSNQDDFRPNDFVTREEAAKFFSQFSMKFLSSYPSTSNTNFSDLNSADPELKDDIIKSYELGLFKDIDGKFLPQSIITKNTALMILINSMSVFQNGKTYSSQDYFQEAQILKLTKETNFSSLDRPITRYEIALILYRASSENAVTDTYRSTQGNIKNVDITDFEFKPQSIIISAGDSIVWTNKDSMNHTVTADNGYFDSSDIVNGHAFTFKFDKAGTYEYHCKIHPNMTGNVIVK